MPRARKIVESKMGLVHIKVRRAEVRASGSFTMYVLLLKSKANVPISHSFYSPTTSCLSPDDAIERDVSVRVDFNLSGDGFMSAANRARGGLIVVVCEASCMSATGYEPHKLRDVAGTTACCNASCRPSCIIIRNSYIHIQLQPWRFGSSPSC